MFFLYLFLLLGLCLGGEVILTESLFSMNQTNLNSESLIIRPSVNNHSYWVDCGGPYMAKIQGESVLTLSGIRLSPCLNSNSFIVINSVLILDNILLESSSLGKTFIDCSGNSLIQITNSKVSYSNFSSTFVVLKDGCNLELINSTFLGNSFTSGFSISGVSQVKVENSSFVNSKSTNSVFASENTSSSLNISLLLSSFLNMQGKFINSRDGIINIHIENSKIDKHKGAQFVYVLRGIANTFTKNLTFTNSGEPSEKASYCYKSSSRGSFTLTDSTFINNQADSGVVSYFYFSNISTILERSTFIGHVSKTIAPVIYIYGDFNNPATFQNLTIRDCVSPNDGAIAIFGDTVRSNPKLMIIRDIHMVNNTAGYGILFSSFRADYNEILIENIYSDSNSGRNSGIVDVINIRCKNFRARNWKSINNKSSYGTTLVFDYQSIIENANLQNIEISNSSTSAIRFADCDVRNITISDLRVQEGPGTVFIVDNLDEVIEINMSNIIVHSMNTSAALFNFNSAKLLVHNSSFYSISSPIFLLTNSESSFVDSTFTRNTRHGSLIKTSGSSFLVENSIFENNRKENELLSATTDNCLFRKVIFNSNSARTIVKVINTNFENNEVSFINNTGLAFEVVNGKNGKINSLLITNSTNNFIYPSGSGESLVVMTTSGNVDMSHLTITNNTVLSATVLSINFLDGNWKLMNSTIKENQGGILSITGFGKGLISDSFFHKNSLSQRSLFIVSDSSYLTLERSTISNNIGRDLIRFEKDQTSTIIKCIFTDNEIQRNTFDIFSGKVDFVEIEINQLYPIEGSCVYLGRLASLSFDKSFIYNCNSSSTVGGIYAEEESTCLIKDCLFQDVSGAIGSVVQTSGLLYATNSTFLDSRSTISSGVMNIIGIKSVAIIDSCKFQKSTSESGASVILASNFANVTIKDTEIHEGLSIDYGCIVFNSAIFSVVGGKVSRCNTGRNGAAIAISGRSVGKIHGIVLEENSALEGGALSFENILGSTIVIMNSTFERNQAENGGSMTFSFDGNKNASVTFEDCNFIDNKAFGFGGVYLSDDRSIISFINCTFENNMAADGGVGYQDWSSFSTFSNCRMYSNHALEFGGSIYLDKSSSVVFSSSTSSNSSCHTSGGVFYLSLKSSISIYSSSFFDNSANVDGGVIGGAINSNCEGKIFNSIAYNNSAGRNGGFGSFDLGKDNSFIVENFNCSFNSAEFGGCFSFDDINFLPILLNVTFEENIAKIYGNDVNSPPQTLKVSIERVSLFSGEEMPSFTVKLISSTGDLYNLPLQQNFLVVVQSNNDSVRLSGLVQQELEDGVASFSSSSNNKIRVSGKAGKYEIYVGPRRNDLVYNPLRFGEVVEVEIKECPEQGFALVDSICRKIECFECSTQNGVCVSANNCSCQNNFEGLRCDLKAGSFETLDIVFQTLPTINRKRSQTINVEMRDFILQEITKSVGNVTVEYRRFFETETGYIFRVALIQNGEYLEGAQLAQYRTVIQDHFSQNFGITPEMSQQEAVGEVLEYTEPVVATSVAFTIIMIILTIFMIVFIFLKRDSTVIKASSPLFCMLILIGILLAFLTIFPYIGPQTSFKCATQTVLAPLSFSIIFGNLLAKTFRIYRIFGNKRLQIVAPTNKMLLAYSGVIISIEMLLVIIWLSVDAPKPVIKGPKDERFWTCESTNPVVGNVMTSLLFILSGFMLAIGVFLAVSTRKAFSAFKETQTIGFCIYGITIVAVAVVPVIYSTPLNVTALFALRSFSLLFVTSFTLLLLFTPKVYAVFKGIDTIEQNSSTKDEISLARRSRELTVDPNLIFGGKFYIKKAGFFSSWKEAFGVIYLDNFGIFDDDSKTSGIGMFPLSSFEFFKSDKKKYGFKMIIGGDSYYVDCKKEEDLKKWTEHLISPHPPIGRPSFSLIHLDQKL